MGQAQQDKIEVITLVKISLPDGQFKANNMWFKIYPSAFKRDNNYNYWFLFSCVSLSYQNAYNYWHRRDQSRRRMRM